MYVHVSLGSTADDGVVHQSEASLSAAPNRGTPVRALGPFAGQDRAMVTIGLVLAGLAALLHVYIFVMESVTWTSPRTRATFGLSAREAEATKQMAYNQGFYNLFLAIVTGIGIALVLSNEDDAGVALVLAGIGSMAAAALVLLLSDRSKARAAITQGTLPVLGIVALLVGVLA